MPQTMTTKLNIGSKIRKIREFKNMTQEELANQLEMTQANYSKIERGDSELKVERLQDIAKVLGIELTDLINFDEKNIFLFQHNRTVSGINGTVNNHYGVTDKERELYEITIKLLKEKVSSLELQLQNTGLKTFNYPEIAVNEDEPSHKTSNS